MRTALVLAAIAAFAADSGVSVIHFGRGFGSDSLPAFDKGYLFFLSQRHGRVSVYKPGGSRAFDAVVLDPRGAAASLSSAAADGRGGVAVSAGFVTDRGYAGMIVFLDASGKQERIVLTGNYMPSHICFDAAGALWTFGWQRDAEDNVRPDRRDYPMVRRFARDGKQTGAFLPRSLFPADADPFEPSFGLWRVRAGTDRVGGIAYLGRADHEPEWVELDSKGRLIGRWKLGSKLFDGGHAYASNGRLFARTYQNPGQIVLEFDKSADRWVPARLATRVNEELGVLLGADGDRLVFADPGGFRLISVAVR
ncbi:MAG: hypothetical protein U0Q16_24445 [Bryobacteraceae bacterium]